MSGAVELLRARHAQLTDEGCAMVEKPFESEFLLAAVRQTVGPPGR